MTAPPVIHIGSTEKSIAFISSTADLTSYTGINTPTSYSVGLPLFMAVSSSRTTASGPVDMQSATVTGPGTMGSPWCFVQDASISWGPGTENRDVGLFTGTADGSSAVPGVTHAHSMLGCLASINAVSGVSGTVLNHYAVAGGPISDGGSTSIGTTGFTAGNPVLGIAVASALMRWTAAAPWDGSAGWISALAGEETLSANNPNSAMGVFFAPRGVPTSKNFVAQVFSGTCYWAVLLAELQLLPITQRRSKGRTLR